MCNLFVLKPDETNEPTDTPLVQSLSSNDVALFRKVCEKFAGLNDGKITLQQVRCQNKRVLDGYQNGYQTTYSMPKIF